MDAPNRVRRKRLPPAPSKARKSTPLSLLSLRTDGRTDGTVRSGSNHIQFASFPGNGSSLRRRHFREGPEGHALLDVTSGEPERWGLDRTPPSGVRGRRRLRCDLRTATDPLLPRSPALFARPSAANGSEVDFRRKAAAETAPFPTLIHKACRPTGSRNPNCDAFSRYNNRLIALIGRFVNKSNLIFPAFF